MTRKKGMVVVLGSLAGQKPIMIEDDDGPCRFETIDAAREFVSKPHWTLERCHNIVIVDVESGDTDVF
jgi:hypothetical protein